MTCTSGLQYEHSVLRKYLLKTAVSDRPRVDFLGFLVPLFRKPFSNGRFKKSEMPFDFLEVGTDPLSGRFQFLTPNNLIGTSEVARDCWVTSVGLLEPNWCLVCGKRSSESPAGRWSERKSAEKRCPAFHFWVVAWFGRVLVLHRWVLAFGLAACQPCRIL
jgi:hypothetical protein